MKKTLIRIWNIYCIVGAVWLTFSILSIGIFHRVNKEEVQGTVKEIIEAEWGGINEVYAIIDTNDDKGNVIAKLYQVGVETNDTVTVNISTSGKGRSYLHASVMN